jgi:hypothetical protein
MKKLMAEGLRDGLNFAENKVNEIKEQMQAIEDAQVQMQRNTHSGVRGGQIGYTPLSEPNDTDDDSVHLCDIASDVS